MSNNNSPGRISRSTIIVLAVLCLTDASYAAGGNPPAPTTASMFDLACIEGAGTNAFKILTKGSEGSELKENEYKQFLFGRSGKHVYYYDATNNKDRSIILGLVEYPDGSFNCSFITRMSPKYSLGQFIDLYKNKYSKIPGVKLEYDKELPHFLVVNRQGIPVLAQFGWNGTYSNYYSYYKSKPPSSINSQHPSPIGDDHAVPLTRSGSTYLVKARINDQISLDFVLDSGASDVSIPADVVSTLIRTDTITSSDFLGENTYVLADGTKVPSPTFRIHSLEVGGLKISDVTASVSSAKGALLLGQSFLQRFATWSIDNANSALILGSQKISNETASSASPSSKESDKSESAEPRILVGQKWAIMDGHEGNENFFMFRRYTFSDAVFKNVLIFNCSKNEGNPNSHITFVLPKELFREAFAEKDWVPEARVRIQIDDKYSFESSAEYSKGEIFLDRNSGNSDMFDRMLKANKIALAAQGHVIATFSASEKADSFISDAAKNVPQMKSIHTVSLDTALQRCRK